MDPNVRPTLVSDFAVLQGPARPLLRQGQSRQAAVTMLPVALEFDVAEIHSRKRERFWKSMTCWPRPENRDVPQVAPFDEAGSRAFTRPFLVNRIRSLYVREVGPVTPCGRPKRSRAGGDEDEILTILGSCACARRRISLVRSGNTANRHNLARSSALSGTPTMPCSSKRAMDSTDFIPVLRVVNIDGRSPKKSRLNHAPHHLKSDLRALLVAKAFNGAPVPRNCR